MKTSAACAVGAMAMLAGTIAPRRINLCHAGRLPKIELSGREAWLRRAGRFVILSEGYSWWGDYLGLPHAHQRCACLSTIAAGSFASCFIYEETTQLVGSPTATRGTVRSFSKIH